MSPNFNELVPPSIAKHLESLSLQATANPSANSGTSKPTTAPPGSSRKKSESYNNVGHAYLNPSQMPHINN
jgi:hypothetical protein